MPNNNRRRPGDSDDFDWDKYEREVRSGRGRRLGGYEEESYTDDNRNDYRYNHDDEGEDGYDESVSRRRIQQESNERKRRRARQNAKDKNRRRRKAVYKKIRFGILTACLVGLVVGSGITIGMYAAVSREISDMDINSFYSDTATTLYYKTSSGEDKEYTRLQPAINQKPVSSGEISQYAKDAIVAIEDERFYKHHGVDIKRTAGATFKYILAKAGIGTSDYGGSTITQQVIKNITNEKENTPGRKIKEMLRAIALERQASKDQILTLYLNIAFFANNCNGIEAASNVYFNKSASDINLQEAASIVGITQFPSEYDPYAHPDKNVEKRNIVLKKMYELNYISEEQYNDAVNSRLRTDNSYKRSGSQMTSYFSDQVVNDVIRDLMDRGYSESLAAQKVYNGGFKIYTTIDPDIQDIMEDVFEDTSNFPSTGRGGQSAMVITDPYTGAVKGIVGGLGEKEDIRGWNRASQAKRQPGSAMKPLAVYAPALDKNKITEASIIDDSPLTIGSDNWKPKNSYNDFYGDMTVREAVARSSNIPAVKVLDEVGLQTSYNYLKNKFHFSSVSDKDINYSSLSLGGLTEGVSPLEMSAAYGAFVNGGKYIAPYTYTEVRDDSDRLILQNSSSGTPAITSSTAYITADLLSGVVNMSMGTGKQAKLDDGMPTYGKTGTTDKNFDRWFVGFTPYYVGAVWYGFDNPSSLSAAGVTGNPCIPAWRKVMNKIHSTLSVKELEKPDEVVDMKICLDTGKIAKSGCNAITMYFLEGNEPKKKCNNVADDRPEDKETSAPSPSAAASESSKPSQPSAAPKSQSGEDDLNDTAPGSSGAETGGGTSSGGTSGGGTSGGGASGGGTSGGGTSGSVSSGGGTSGGNPSGGGTSGGDTSGGSSGGNSSGGASTENIE